MLGLYIREWCSEGQDVTWWVMAGVRIVDGPAEAFWGGTVGEARVGGIKGVWESELAKG